MHSRIYQITTAPVKQEDYITESDFYEHWFTNSVADYVDGDVDRANDIEWLRERLEKVVRFDSADSFVILPNGKETYFANAFKSFTEARDKTVNMGLPEFSSGGELEGSMYRMKTAYCEKFDFYVSSDEFDTIPLDEFIRYAEIGCRYYIGGTLDYHF